MTSKMTHPGSDLEIEVRADQVAMYEAEGWETGPVTKPSAQGDSKK